MNKQKETKDVKKSVQTKKMEQTKKRKNYKKKKVYFILGIFVSVFALLYCMISLFFNTHYFFHTSINGIDCSLKTEEVAKKLILEQSEGYKLQLEGRNKLTGEILAKDIDLTFSFDDSMQKVKESEIPILWVTSLFDKKDFLLNKLISFDKEKLSTEIAKLSFFEEKNISKPVDASISEYQKDSNSYSIIPEDNGNELDEEKTNIAIGKAISSMEDSLDLDTAQCYVEPKVKSNDKDIQDTLAELNKCVKAKITYDWNTHPEVVDSTKISSWIKVDGIKYSFDEEAMSDWISSCAYKYDTYGKTRTFTTATGETKSLASGGYGWRTDRKAELTKLKEEIQAGKNVNREPVYSHTAAQKGDNDIGSSYVEANLTAQHLYVFINGSVVFETDCVSGNVSKGNGTPAGVFGITYKEKHATLKGENYTTPVNYWMPFNGNVGMHDAVWRSEFGGDIYLTKGSHGCINLPLSSAETIFGYVKEGFPVVCYY